MDWVAISVTDFVTEGFSATERTAIEAAAGAGGIAAILTGAIAEWRGVISAAGQEVDADTTLIPPSCRRHIIAQVRWSLLLTLSQLKQLQTEERKAANDAAEEVLTAIAEGDRAIEDPDEEADEVGAGGTWGSKVQVEMRLSNTDDTA